MKKLWNTISYLGIENSYKDDTSQTLILTNRINYIIFLVMLILNIITAVLREINHGVYTIHTKNLLVLLIICLLNFGFSYLKQHKITIISLTFFPVLVLVDGPILLGFPQNEDLIYTPLTILTLSIVVQIIIDVKQYIYLYYIALAFFLVNIVFILELLQFFSKGKINFPEFDPLFSIYYKITVAAVFIFLHSVILYLKNINVKFRQALAEQNEELVAALESLKNAQEIMIQSEKMASLGILTAGVAHEIHNPVNFIANGIKAIELKLKNNNANSPEDIKPYIAAINIGVVRISEIVKNLGKYSRSESLPVSCFNLHEVVNNCLSMLNAQLQDKIEIKKNYTDFSPFISANEGELQHALTNILTNSIQSIENYGIITITTLRDGSFIKLMIEDTGNGISQANLKFIFDPFFTTKNPGVGLGLSIARSFIIRHNGTIFCTSEVGKGTCMMITFTLSENPPEK